MAGIRKVFGPFALTEHKGHMTSVNGGRAKRMNAHIDWHFFGIRDDHTMAAWFLRYVAETRTFHAHNMPIGDVGGVKMRRMMADNAIPRIEKARVVHPDAYLNPSDRMHTGKVTDILRKHLKPEDLARATALSVLCR